MLGIGVAIMLYVRFWGGSDYFKLTRETYAAHRRTSRGRRR